MMALLLKECRSCVAIAKQMWADKQKRSCLALLQKVSCAPRPLVPQLECRMCGCSLCRSYC